jgi:hypothetical protein
MAGRVTWTENTDQLKNFIEETPFQTQPKEIHKR